ncbi:4349_t:CDS:2, partial [Gigaspora rosea]
FDHTNFMAYDTSSSPIDILVLVIGVFGFDSLSQNTHLALTYRTSHYK